MPIPDSLELPNLRKLENLKKNGGPGRAKGSKNKITRSLKEGILAGAVEHGSDGAGTDGLGGYLRMCAARYPKQYMQLLARLLPHVIKDDGASVAAVGMINIVTVPVGQHLTRDEIERIEGQPERLLEAEASASESSPVVPLRRR